MCVHARLCMFVWQARVCACMFACVRVCVCVCVCVCSRSDDDHEAVAEDADAHQQVGERQPELQHTDGPLVVIVTIEQDRVLHEPLSTTNTSDSGTLGTFHVAGKLSV